MMVDEKMSYKDKAKKIDFSVPTGDIQTESVSDSQDLATQLKPKTAPGAMMQIAKELRTERLKETEDLKMQAATVTLLQNKLDGAIQDLIQWEGAKATKLIDPNLILPSEWANRHNSSYQTQDFKELVEEIASSGGNVQPIKVRPISKIDPQHFEIVYGHRRHQACLELGLPVLALIDSIDDKSLFIEMDRENRQRKDLRPYEQGMMYRRALERSLYPSLRALCEATGANQGNGALALRLAKMPDVILDAFPSRLDIQFRWILPLLKAHEEDPNEIISRAQSITLAKNSTPDMTSVDVFMKLIRVSKDAGKHGNYVQTINVNGNEIATITHKKNSYRFEFEQNTLSEEGVVKIRAFIEKLFKLA